MIKLPLTILSRTPNPCSPSCKCRACHTEIPYAHAAQNVTIKIGEAEFTVRICRACGRMNDAWILSAMRKISLHKQGLCMADKFDNQLVRAECDTSS